jgi:hypothetical protein
MRKLITVLVSAVLLLSAGAATALSINPNPVNQLRGATLDADVTLLSLSGDTMTFQLSVTTGGITQIDVSMLFDSLGAPTLFSFVSATGVNASTGDVGATAINAVNEAQIIFDSTVTAGNTSDEFWVQFDAAIQQTWEGGITFDTGVAQDSTYTITPEPSTLLLMGSALGGLAVLGRRRRA